MPQVSEPKEQDDGVAAAVDQAIVACEADKRRRAGPCAAFQAGFGGKPMAALTAFYRSVEIAVQPHSKRGETRGIIF
jgi:hypothetical protein